ncbi:hypothetical protein [Phenylobacterium sp.]|uniref:hypothetical protein n=1 Tax=Phenylobacterium sp. TaxID=1871053 RepID=UPI0025FAE857|nr:hypothetical protein [Phenylobacterium sp.]
MPLIALPSFHFGETRPHDPQRLGGGFLLRREIRRDRTKRNHVIGILASFDKRENFAGPRELRARAFRLFPMNQDIEKQAHRAMLRGGQGKGLAHLNAPSWK